MSWVRIPPRAVFSLKKEKAVLGVYICLALIYHVQYACSCKCTCTHVHVCPLSPGSCKRANDWISEAKYPVITRDSTGGTCTEAGGTPVVLGKIKRIKSMQPKPLEEEIAKSLGEHV